VAAGPAPGRLFPQLSPEEQHSGGLSNCACRRCAPAGLIIPISPVLFCIYRLAAACRGRQRRKFWRNSVTGLAAARKSSVQAAFAIIPGWFAWRARSALWFRAPAVAWSAGEAAGRARGALPARSARFPARRG